jgi:hypothetical protein
MTPLRRRPDAAAGWNFALVVRAPIVAQVYAPMPGAVK